MSRSLEAIDQESEKYAVAPRVSLASMEEKIGSKYFALGSDFAGDMPAEHEASLPVLTICILVMKNGFIVVGKSAPASPENFNAEYGQQLAYEDCIHQLWGHEGYLLRERLSSESNSSS